MEINELKTFVEVARSGSFSLAAEKLFLTQPAISKRISTLETGLGANLFDRIGHKVSLTEAGKALMPKAEAVLLDLEDIKRSINNIGDEISGDLVIGASHHVGLRRLPPVLKAYSRSYPEVNLDISFVDSEAAHDAVQSGELELAIVTLSEQEKTNINSIKIWDDNLHIVVAKEHLLARQKKVALEDLAKYKAILPSERTFTRSIVEATFKEREIPIKIAMNTNYIETIRMMVSIGMGWSALPETMIDNDLKVLDIKDISISRELGCIYHDRRSLSNAANALLDLLKAENPVP